MQEFKTSSSIAAEPHQHLHQDQGSLRTITLEDLFEKPSKTHSIIFITLKMFNLC